MVGTRLRDRDTEAERQKVEIRRPQGTVQRYQVETPSPRLKQQAFRLLH